MTLSVKNRSEAFKKLDNNTQFDVLIIGGGITGAGIALDAAKRGMSVVLVDMQDFAAGTSSRSTKLVHGGLRYLKQFQIKVVAETGKERAIVYENGSHVTTPEWMLLPIHQGGTFGLFSTSIGLRVYDFLAGVKSVERRKMLSQEEVRIKAPTLKLPGLKGGGFYVEYRTDDARLTIEVMKKAAECGATIFNYVQAETFHYDANKKVNGMKVTDLLTQQSYDIHAKKVINASGIWVHDICEKDYSVSGKKLRLTKGIHLVIDQAHFPLTQAVYFDTEKDGRMIFAIPRQGKIYVGTTDTSFDKEKKNPRVTIQDRDYIIDAINYMFPTIHLTAEHIESSWAGIRPLILEEGKGPSEISRKDEIWEASSGLLTIAGGKLTGYRHMAEEIVDRLVERLNEEQSVHFGKCTTKHEPISGGDFGGSDKLKPFIESKAKEAPAYGLTVDEGKMLAAFYGTNVDQIYQLAKHQGETNTHALPLALYARLLYAIEHEYTITPEDFFIRRTGALFFDINWVKTYKEPVINTMKQLLQWDDETTQRYTAALDNAILDVTVLVNE